VEADPFGFRPRPTRAGTAIGGVAGRKEHGRGGAKETDGPDLRERWPLVEGDGDGVFLRAMAAFGRRRQSEAMPALRARRGATGRNRPEGARA
jgi:hypothetical protein